MNDSPHQKTPLDKIYQANQLNPQAVKKLLEEKDLDSLEQRLLLLYDRFDDLVDTVRIAIKENEKCLKSQQLPPLEAEKLAKTWKIQVR